MMGESEFVKLEGVLEGPRCLWRQKGPPEVIAFMVLHPWQPSRSNQANLFYLMFTKHTIRRKINNHQF